MNQIPERKTCRISNSPLLPLFTLGELYISDFIKQEDSEPRLPKIELKMCISPESGLVQLAHTAPFDDMYREYWYKSGTNQTMTLELKDIAESGMKLAKTKPGDVWVDIGCNDGTLLSFLDKRLTRIGFDPAKNGYSELSRPHANLIVEDYFNKESFLNSEFKDKKARVITSIAMFYDLEEPHKFVQDIYEILDDNGTWIIQMSYLPLMLQQMAFDNICHEHTLYYSLSSLKYLLEKNGMKIVDCQLNDVNGGSFRIYIQKETADEGSFGAAPYRDVANFRVQSILSHEEKLGLDKPETYHTFFEKMKELKDKTVNFIRSEKKKGKKIWGYGASTKGNTLLQWYGLNENDIDGIAERQERKYGLKTAGSNIVIYSEEEMRKANPDYLLVLPWHFIREFVEREQEFLKNGGKFIVPCPDFKVIGISE